MSAVILDLDGTLVDSVYLHVITWHDTLREAGRDVPAARIHAGIGLGSDRLVPFLLGEVIDQDEVEVLSAVHRTRFLDRADVLRPTPGARDLLDDLGGRGVPFVVATSAGAEERKALLAVLGDPDVDVTDADSADSSKPHPDPLVAAAGQIGAELGPSTLMVGDAVWDGHAAAAAGVGFVAVTCGGFSEQALRRAGARWVVESPAQLLGTL